MPSELDSKYSGGPAPEGTGFPRLLGGGWLGDLDREGGRGDVAGVPREEPGDGGTSPELTGEASHSAQPEPASEGEGRLRVESS